MLESAKHRVSTYYQGYEVTITEYVEHFKALVGVVETYVGVYGNEPGLVKAQMLEQGMLAVDVDTPNADKLKKALAVCVNSYLLCMILQGSDNSRFYQLKTDLANDMTKGQDNFPKNIVKTTHLLNNYKVPARQQHVKDPNNNGVAFVQSMGGTAPPLVGDILCWHCGKKEHYRSNCPELQVQEINVRVQNLNIGNCEEGHGLFSSKKDKILAIVQDKEREEKGVQGILSKYHLFINTCASYASTPYCKHLGNMEVQERGLVGHSNMGPCGMDTTGDMGAIKQMCLNKGGVAAIVPLKVLEKIWPITYDSRRHGGQFVWHTDQGDIVIKNNSKGMPYPYIQELETKLVLSFIQTVQGNMEGYTSRKVEEACAMQEAQAMLDHPTDQEFLGMVCSGMILNCPVTLTAVQNANRIFRSDLAGLRGQTVRRPPESTTTNHVKIPRAIQEQHQQIAQQSMLCLLTGYHS